MPRYAKAADFLITAGIFYVQKICVVGSLRVKAKVNPRTYKGEGNFFFLGGGGGGHGGGRGFTLQR